MKATITKVETQTDNQLNVSVLYEDEANSFSREQVFTLPASEMGTMDEDRLQSMIQAQGKEFVAILAKKDDIIALQGNEYEIK